MATKNMARTVIEGGRTHYSKEYRQATHGIERALARETLHRMAKDEDGGDGQVFARRPMAHRGFSDKLGPARRWLLAQLGRPWDKVRSELFARFDARTTAGRHILFDHVLGWVSTSVVHERFHRYYVCVVGRGGILRPMNEPPRTRRAWQPDSRPAWCEFVAGRKVGQRGRALFWFDRTPAERFRQGGRLTDEEAGYWNALPAAFRAAHGMEL